LAAGVALTMIAGLMAGNCMLPFKFLRSWKWENAWLVFSIASLVLLPWGLAIALVDNLFQTYRTLSLQQLAIPMLLGAGWGIAQILFGISVDRLGLGIAYAIIVGLGAALGTLVPLLVQQRALAGRHAIELIVAGVAIMALGMFLTARGGQIRESAAISFSPNPSRQGYRAAILLAVLCGVLAPMLNYSFAFGQDIARQAVRMGNPATHAAYAVWPIALAGGFIPNVAYSLYLISKKQTWPLFRSAGPDLFWSFLMAVLWMGAFALYGMSAIYLGSLGTSVGWGLLQIFMIMAATFSGILTGEWNHAPRDAKISLGSGLVSLAGAIVLLALASQ
jgi:L-rhamnose-H+ transport protein